MNSRNVCENTNSKEPGNTNINAYKLFIKGKKYADNNDHIKAVMLFEKAIKLEPMKGSIREALATSCFNCGLYEEAKKHFCKALNIDSANDFAHYGLGFCLVKEGDSGNAIGHFKIACAMKPLNKNYSDAIVRYSRIFDIFHIRLPQPEEGQ